MSDPTQKSYLYLAKPSLVKEWHPTKNGNLKPKNVTTEHDEKIWWLCENGHEWEATVKDRLMGMSCPACAKDWVEEKSQKAGYSTYQQKSLGDEGAVSQRANPFFKLETFSPYVGPEFRKFPRYNYKATAMLEDPISGNSVYGQMQNFSKGGMGFETSAFFKQGEKVTVKFNEPLFFSRSKIFTSTVRWSKELTDDEGYNYGFGLGLKLG